MKKLLFILCLLPTAISIFAQKQFNEAQLKLRSNIESFLREEGFMPTIDNDGDILFKKEGEKYFVIIDQRDTSPFYLCLCKYYNYSENFTKQKIEKNLSELNLRKGVKLICFDKNYRYGAEMYLVNAENFKYVFYKLMKQLEALQEEVNKICSNQSNAITERTSGQRNNGTFLVNEDFSSYSPLWKTSKGEVSFKNGRIIFKDIEDSGYSELFYDLPKNIKNEDFQLTFSMKATFGKQYSSLFFILGSKWDNAYRFGFTDWNEGIIRLSYGTSDNSKKYYGYSKNSNLAISATHRYTMIKKGKKVEWYANGNLLFSTTIDLSTDMNLMGFLVAGRHMIEVDSLTLKLI